MIASSTLFIILSSILTLVSPLFYARAILIGEAKPHRTTCLVLLIITALSTTSLLASHNTVAVWLAGVSTLQSIVIFSLSIKYGMGGWEKMDVICLIIALIGIIVWQTTNNPILGLYFSILADLTGMVPSIIKTYRFPETEIATYFALDSMAGIFSLLAVGSFIFADISYPIYIFLINALMAVLVLLPRLRKTNN